MALPGKFGALTCDMGKRGQRGRSGKTKRPEAGSAGLAGLDDGNELKRRLYSTCNMIHRDFTRLRSCQSSFWQGGSVDKQLLDNQVILVRGIVLPGN